MQTPEGKVKDAIKRVLRARGTWFYMPVQNGLGVHGIPDFVCCHPVLITEDMVGKTLGAFVGIEAKAVGKERNTSAHQKMVIAQINEHGGLAFVTSDAEIVEDNLNKLEGVIYE